MGKAMTSFLGRATFPSTTAPAVDRSYSPHKASTHTQVTYEPTQSHDPQSTCKHYLSRVPRFRDHGFARRLGRGG